MAYTLYDVALLEAGRASEQAVVLLLYVDTPCFARSRACFIPRCWLSLSACPTGRGSLLACACACPPHFPRCLLSFSACPTGRGSLLSAVVAEPVALWRGFDGRDQTKHMEPLITSLPLPVATQQHLRCVFTPAANLTPSEEDIGSET